MDQYTGLPPAADGPCTATNGSCSSATTVWQSATDKIPTSNRVTTASPDVDKIKNALFTHGSLVTAMQLSPISTLPQAKYIATLRVVMKVAMPS